MATITPEANVKMVLTARYNHHGATHADHYYCGTVNMWRDAFLQEVFTRLIGCSDGDRLVLAENFQISRFTPQLRFPARTEQWQPPKELHQFPFPRAGRWYPQGYLRGAPHIFPQSVKPLLVRTIARDWLEIDCNHPLAGVPLTIEAEILEISNQSKERGGRCTDWFEELTDNGPGIQLLREGVTPDYSEGYGQQREDESDDADFYRHPRLTGHIDSRAGQHLLDTTATLLTPGMRILDLMASVQSHLPEGYHATGLGLNEEEMKANPHLTEILVHDLNKNPRLPFPDASFDCVCCHLSIEYLLEPEAVMADVSRVLTPSGTCIVSFSNRWFPPKVTPLWQTLHEFERSRFVMAVMERQFENFATYSFRNWPRPLTDPHAGLYMLSDPLSTVTGCKKMPG